MDLKPCKDSLAEHETLCKVNEKYDKNKVPGDLPLTINPTFDILQVAEVNIIDGSISTIIDLKYSTYILLIISKLLYYSVIKNNSSSLKQLAPG